MVKNLKGFTLTELIIVFVILGILVSIALPILTDYIRQTSSLEAFTNLNAYKVDFVNCLRAHRGNEIVCYDQKQQCLGIFLDPIEANRCMLKQPGGKFKYYYISNYYYKNVGNGNNLVRQSSDPQGWIVAALEEKNFANIIFLSGSADGTKNICGGLGWWKGIC